MQQQIYNSLSGKLETFVPIVPGQVRMYVCGMTVYDYCHLGHARAMVIFDMVSRYLRNQGYQVTYVRNITDIDDKIIQRANDNGETIQALTTRFIDAMQIDAAALGVLAPDHEPRAMQYIDRMILLIEKMIAAGVAYVGSNGDVYASPESFEEYGKLSKKRLKDLRAGDRIEVDPAKKSSFDFVLWKKARDGEPRWPSPWGEGRPSWHVECCAMSTDLLGESFDIHGGGVDLQFPHHENEIMISESAHGKIYANYWMHNGHVKVQSETQPGEFEKMAKSLGNFFTIRDMLKVWRAEEIRLFLLSSHYRSPLNYSNDNLMQARQVLTRYYLALRDIIPLPADTTGLIWRNAFHDAMLSDFNTPKALSVLADLVSQLNRLIKTTPEGNEGEEARQLAGLLIELGRILGLLESEPETFFQSMPSGASDGLTDAEIDDLVEQRKTARAEKNWAEADRIRQLLLEADIQIEDKTGTTAWRRG